MAGLAVLWVFSSAAFAEVITCDTLESCADKTKILLAQNPGPERGAEYKSVDAAFSQFGQDGFNALFQIMLDADSKHQGFLLSAVRSMMPSKKVTGFELSGSQTEDLIRLWNAAPTYKLTSIINRVDTPRTHAFLIEALKAQDADKREWAEKVIHRFGIGNSETPVASEHLNDLLDMIETQNSHAALGVLIRIDSPAAQDALWSMLESENKFIFQNAFETLKKRDYPKLYPAIRDLKFENTEADKARAVMIAQVIAQNRRKISPAPKTFNYWKSWYGASDPANPEHLIPTYMLFDFHEKSVRKISGSEREIQRLTEGLEEAETNTMENMRGLTQEKWIKIFSSGLKKYDVLPNLIEATTSVLTENETAVAGEYFHIFDIMQQQTDNYNYSSYQLPFPKVLETAIQTNSLWLDAFSRRLKCGPSEDSYAVMTQIAELDPNNARLKSCIKERLNYLDKMPLLLETLSFISRYEALRVDRDLHKSVSLIDDKHPFTSIRLTRQIILSAGPAPEFRGRGNSISWGPRKDLLKDLNANRTHCEAKPLGKFAYIDTPSKFFDPTSFNHVRRGPPILTVKTPSGYLTGHNRGEFGGGLMYYADRKSEPKALHDKNMIAIIESDEPSIYWGLSGLNHMIPGTGKIHRIDARTDAVSIELHKEMPIVTNNVKLLKNGDLFMDFWRRTRTSYSQSHGKTVEKIPSPDFNPPVLLTRGGAIKVACED